MAIGPEARRAASGRIVVVAGLLGACGATTLILGAGPMLVPAGPLERAIGVAAMALGGVMLLAGAALGLRLRAARILGIAGGASLAVIGVAIVVAASATLPGCGGSSERAIACVTLVGGTGVAGVGLVAAGVASAYVVSRARPEFLRRPRRQPRRR
ncbi:MAG TPA: hypothetical protein VHR55_06470 [Candidatus Limnocylindria bacterium]|nr:hypothetical protein [Candidatus Limnocylindria bacterium]